MKAGTRLKSAACDCEVMVVRAPQGAAALQCGGFDMLAIDGERDEGRQPLSGLDGGTLLGKRYADASAGVEVLCTKGGRGSLWYAGAALEQHSARPLPASD